MRLDCEAIAGLPCLEEALDCFRDAGLLQFITDKEHWNEELLLQLDDGNDRDHNLSVSKPADLG